MVTYAVIGFFVLVCLLLIFGYSRLLQRQSQMQKARASAERLASAEHDATYANARDSYNQAVASFPTNLVALVTGFRRAE